jgi:hypothetical protein
LETGKTEALILSASDKVAVTHKGDFQDHPLRQALANELHARPFPTLSAPMRAAFLAIKHPVDAANRDPRLDRAHLLALLDHYGTNHPPEGATHYQGELGK